MSKPTVPKSGEGNLIHWWLSAKILVGFSTHSSRRVQVLVQELKLEYEQRNLMRQYFPEGQCEWTTH